MNFYTYFHSTNEIHSEDGFNLNYERYPTVPAVLVTAEASTGRYGDPCDRLSVQAVVSEETDGTFPDLLYLTMRPVNLTTRARVLSGRSPEYWLAFMAMQTRMHREAMRELDPACDGGVVNWQREGF